MLSSGNELQIFADKLANPAESYEEKFKVAEHIMEGLEIAHTMEYGNFLKVMFPVFKSVLLSPRPEIPELDPNLPPKEAQEAQDAARRDAAHLHKLKVTVLEVLNRLPQHNEPLRAYVDDLLDTCMQLLATDVEEVSLICMRIVFDLHKNFRGPLQDKAKSFLDFARQIVDNIPRMYEQFLSPQSLARGDAVQTEQLPSSLSIKVAIECPLPIIFLFQVYPGYHPAYIDAFLPAMLDAIAIEGPAPHEVPPARVGMLTDFRQAQTKILNFLTYLARTYSDRLRSNRDRLCSSVANLFRKAPDVVSIRKELLVGLRHIVRVPQGVPEARELTHEWHAACMPYLSTFLEDRYFVGSSVACQENIRSLAYTTLAEIVHNIRKQLKVEQCSAIVHKYSRALHDPTLNTGVHQTCVVLICNVIEVVFASANAAGAAPEDAHLARRILVRSLECWLDKMAVISREAAALVESAAKEKEAIQKQQDAVKAKKASAATALPDEEALSGAGGDKAGKEKKEAGAKEEDKEGTKEGEEPAAAPAPAPAAEGEAVAGAAEGESVAAAAVARGSSPAPARPPRTLQRESPVVPVKVKEMQERRQLLQTLIMALKNTVGFLEGTPIRGQQPAAGLAEDEIRTLGRLLSVGLGSLKLVEGEGPEVTHKVFDRFCEVFVAMSPMTFLDVMARRFRYLYDAILKTPGLRQIAQVLLCHSSGIQQPQHLAPRPTNQKISHAFAEALLSYLCSEKLHHLDSPKSTEGDLVLKLFSMAFNAVSRKFIPEQVIGPRLMLLIDTCLRKIKTAADRTGYLSLLRSLFRSLHSQSTSWEPVPAQPAAPGLPTTFEPLPLREFMAAVPRIFRDLTALLKGPCEPHHRDICVELILHVPVQLKHLQAYNLLGELRYLTRPLVMALQGPDDLIIFGLQTLEYLIDSINIEFLEPLLEGVMSDLLRALFALLKPQTLMAGERYNYSIKAMSILGKLGGRNRRALKEPSPLDNKASTDGGVRLVCAFEPEVYFSLPMDKLAPCLRAAVRNEPLPVTLVRPLQRSPHHRTQALQCLETCLCTVLGMRPPTESVYDDAAEDILREAIFGAGPSAAAAAPQGSSDEATPHGPAGDQPQPAAAAADAAAPAAGAEPSGDRATPQAELGSGATGGSGAAGAASGVAGGAAAGAGPAAPGAPSAGPGAPAAPAPRPGHSARHSSVRRSTQPLEPDVGVLTSLLSTLLFAAADPILSARAKPFAEGVVRHVGLLVAAGRLEPAVAQAVAASVVVPVPHPPPHSASTATLADKDKDKDKEEGAVQDGEKEKDKEKEDTRDASQARSAAPEGAKPDEPAGGSPSRSSSGGTASGGLTRVLQRSPPMAAVTEVLLTQLSSSKLAEREVAAELTRLFVNTAHVVYKDRRRLAAPTKAAGDAPMDVDGDGDGDAPAAPAAAHPTATGLEVPPLLEEFLAVILHACHSRTWSRAMGGARALAALMAPSALPGPAAAAFLRSAFAGEGAHRTFRALAFLFDHLPAHAQPEADEVQGVMSRALHLLLGKKVLDAPQRPAEGFTASPEPSMHDRYSLWRPERLGPGDKDRSAAEKEEKEKGAAMDVDPPAAAEAEDKGPGDAAAPVDPAAKAEVEEAIPPPSPSVTRQLFALLLDASASKFTGPRHMAAAQRLLPEIAALEGRGLGALIADLDASRPAAPKYAARVAHNLSFLKRLGSVPALAQFCLRQPVHLHVREVSGALHALRLALSLPDSPGVMSTEDRADAARVVKEMALPLCEADDAGMLPKELLAALTAAAAPSGEPSQAAAQPTQLLAMLPLECHVELRAAALALTAAYVAGEPLPTAPAATPAAAPAVVPSTAAATTPEAAPADGATREGTEASAEGEKEKEKEKDKPAAADSAAAARLASPAVGGGASSQGGSGSAGQGSLTAPSEAQVILDRFADATLRALLSAHPEVVEAGLICCGVLRTFAPADPAAPKHLLRQPLKKILHDLTDLESLRLPFIRGLKLIMANMPGILNESMGDHVLKTHLERHKNHLGSYNPLWQPHEEPLMGAAFMALYELFSGPQTPQLVESQNERSGLAVSVIQTEPLLLGAVLQQAMRPVGRAPIPLCNGYFQSPYRAPLIAFLAKNREAALNYFLDKRRFDKSNYFHLYLDILKAPGGLPLVEHLTQNIAKLVDSADLAPRPPSAPSSAKDGALAEASEPPPAAGAAPGAPHAELGAQADPAHPHPPHHHHGPYHLPGDTDSHGSFHGIHLLSVLCRLMPGWIKDQHALAALLVARWRTERRAARMQHEEHLQRYRLLETKRLAKCIIAYIRCNPDKAPLAFDLLAAFSLDTDRRSRVDYSFVRDFLTNDLQTLLTTSEQKQAVFEAFYSDLSELRAHMDILAQTPALKANPVAAALGDAKFRALQERMIFALRYIVRPLVERVTELREVSDVITHDKLAGYIGVIAGMTEIEGVIETIGEALHIELLQLSTTLIKYNELDLKEFKKDLIRFGWWHLKGDDSPCKFHAYLYVCQFIDRYNTPDKITLQVFVSLLKACNVEARPLVRQALDVLTPILPSKLVDPSQKPLWVRYVKRSLVEEGHSLPHLMHIWHLMVRHPDLFFPSRGAFVPLMVNSLARLGLPSQTGPDNRRLSLDIAGLVLKWERDRRSRAPESRAASQPPPVVGAKRDRPDDAGGPQPSISLGAGIATDSTLSAAAAAIGMDGAEARSAKLVRNEAGEAVPPAPQSPVAPRPDGTPGDSQFPRSESAASMLPGQAGTSGGAGGTAPPAGAGHTSSSVDPSAPDFRPSPQITEMVVNFAIRMLFVLRDGNPRESRSPENEALFDQALEILLEALELFPGTPVKLTYFKRLLEKHEREGTSAPPGILLSGLSVMNAVLDTQGATALVASKDELQMALTHIFNAVRPTKESLSPDEVMTYAELSRSLAQICFKFAKRFPPGPANAAVSEEASAAAAVHDALSDKFGQQLRHALKTLADKEQEMARIIASGSALPEPQEAYSQVYSAEVAAGLLRAAIAIESARALQLANLGTPGSLLEFASELLFKVSREHTKLFQTAQAGPPMPPRPLCTMKGDYATADPPFGSPLWLFKNAVAYLRPHCLAQDKTKNYVIRTMVLLINDQHGSVRQTDRLVYMEILKSVRYWIAGSPRAGALTIKETYAFLQRLAHLERGAPVTVSMNAEWETEFLALLYRCCTEVVGPHGTLLMNEVFSKVEKVFHSGLKSSDPAMRKSFFGLYDRSVDRSVFARLQYIVQEADWEALAYGFWLKQALDLLMALVVQDAPLQASSGGHAPTLFPTLRPEESLKRVLQARSIERQGELIRRMTATLEYTTRNVQEEIRQHEEAHKAALAAAAAVKQQKQEAAAAAAAAGDAAAADGGAMVVDGAPPPGSVLNPILPGPAGEGALEEAKPADLAGGDAKADEAPQIPFTLPPHITEKQRQLKELEDRITQYRRQREELMASRQPEPVRGAVPSTAPQASDLSPAARDTLSKHAAFLQSSCRRTVRDFVEPLMEAAHEDATVAHTLWVIMWPIVWTTLGKEQQVGLAKPIINLLSKEYHNRQAAARPNVIQTLLEGIHHSQPQPKIPAELVKFLGKHFSAWHVATAFLEQQVINFPSETRPFDALSDMYRLLQEEDLLAGLWKRLGKLESQDKSRGVCPETLSALGLTQHGFWDRSQEVLEAAIATYAIREDRIQPPPPPGAPPVAPQSMGPPSRSECLLWEDRWLQSARNLGQWGRVLDYATKSELRVVQMESAWKLGDWARLPREEVRAIMLEDSNPDSILMRAYYRIMSDKDSGMGENKAQQEVTQLAQLAGQQAINRWWQLPTFVGQAHVPLLQTFQRIQELHESMKLMQCLHFSLVGQALPGRPLVPPTRAADEIAEILDIWRIRSANPWDNLSHWYDVVLWRLNMLNYIIGLDMHGAPAHSPLVPAALAKGLAESSIKEKAAMLNQFGSIARMQGMHNLCVDIVTNLYGHPQIDVNEACTKLCEQGRAYLEVPAEFHVGLNMISQEVMDYFGPQQQAEIFRIKGLLCEAMGEVQEASNNFVTSLALCRTSADTWHSWGSFCDSQMKKQRRLQSQALARDGPMPPGNPELIEKAAACYLQALKLGATQSRVIVPRLLSLLSSENDVGAASKAFDRFTWNDFPLGVFVPWIQSLVATLQMPEGRHIRGLLRQLGLAHPQPVYLQVRNLLLQTSPLVKIVQARKKMGEAKEAAAKEAKEAADVASEKEKKEGSEAPTAASGDGTTTTATAAAASTGGKVEDAAVSAPAATTPAAAAAAAGAPPSAAPTPAAAPAAPGPPTMETTTYEWGKEIMDELCRAWPTLKSSLEAVLSHISQAFNPRQEERIITVLHSVLLRCYKLPAGPQAEVPQQLHDTLASISAQFFMPDPQSGKTLAPILASVKDAFDRDLKPSDPGGRFPKNLGDLADRLKFWRAALMRLVEDRVPPMLRLEDEAPSLHDMPLGDIEMPGSYQNLGGDGSPPQADLLVRVECIGSDVDVVRRNGIAYRRLAFHGTDGRVRHFLVHCTYGNPLTSDARLHHLLASFNRLLDSHTETRRRGLGFYVPVSEPLYMQLTLLEDDPSYSLLGECYDNHVAKSGREWDEPIRRYKEMRCDDKGQFLADPTNERSYKTYTEICRSVPDNLLQSFMTRSASSVNQMQALRRVFCQQVALTGLVTYLMNVGGRTPYRILISKATGKILHMDFAPSFDPTEPPRFGRLQDPREFMPFRLTRNMVTFMGQFNLEGPFVTSLAAACQALAQRGAGTDDLLMVYFRDEMLSLNTERQARHVKAGHAAGAVPLRPSEIREAVVQNTALVTRKVAELTPRDPEHPRQLWRAQQVKLAQEAQAEAAAAAAAAKQEGADGAPPPPQRPKAAQIGPDPYLVSVQKRTQDLIHYATDPRSLCKADPMTMAWL